MFDIWATANTKSNYKNAGWLRLLTIPMHLLTSITQSADVSISFLAADAPRFFHFMA